MKLNLKPLIETTEQLNLRIPGTLKKRMDNTRARARNLGIDYNATLIANLEEFEREFEAQLSARQEATGSSLEALEPPNINSPNTPLAKANQPNLSSASSNSSPRERA
jgi:hypothetical protein